MRHAIGRQHKVHAKILESAVGRPAGNVRHCFPRQGGQSCGDRGQVVPERDGAFGASAGVVDATGCIIHVIACHGPSQVGANLAAELGRVVRVGAAVRNMDRGVESRIIIIIITIAVISIRKLLIGDM